MKTSALIRTLLAAALMAAASAYAAEPAKLTGGMLTGNDGMTLYTFDKDPAGAGKSLCNEACAANWPPLMAKSDDQASGDYSIIKRDDGTMQWALKGKPLYHWSHDKKPGDMTGDGFKGLWHVVKP